MGGPGEKSVDACRCPFCDVEMEARAESVLCVACRTVIVECARCGRPVRDGVDECPHCGQPPRLERGRKSRE